MRKYFFLILLFTMVSLGASQVHYSGSMNSDSSKINMSMRMDCQPENCPVSRWTVTMSVPEAAELIDVKSARGTVESQDREGGELEVKTRTPPSETEMITIVYEMEENRKHVHSGLFTQRINLPGFNAESNSGSFRINNLLSASPSGGFRVSKSGNQLNYTGVGPGNVVVATGNGFDTQYYEFFGENPENTSLAYELTAGTLGFDQSFEKLPVAVMPDQKYNETINRWSAGQYTNASLVLRDNLEDEFLPILAHETVHAFNDQRLNWDSESSWFDEGTARYIEYLTKKTLKGDSRTRSLFWDEKTYIEYEDGDRYRYTLPSKGNKEHLWRYYQDDRKFMKYWSPDDGERDFGYAYSELIIRNYIRKNNSLKELYDKIELKLMSDEEKWSQLSQEIDLTPCKYEDREKFENCLEEVNEYDYPVYEARNLSKAGYNIEVRKLDIPEKNDSIGGALLSNDSGERENAGSGSSVGRFMESLSDLILRIVDLFKGI